MEMGSKHPDLGTERLQCLGREAAVLSEKSRTQEVTLWDSVTYREHLGAAGAAGARERLPAGPRSPWNHMDVVVAHLGEML